MARTRILKIGFFENELLAQLPDKARLLYAGLWLIADREGRLQDRPSRIRVKIFPYETDVDCDALLSRLADAGFIRRYADSGGLMKVIDIPSFHEHQTPHHREQESNLPAFPEKPDLGRALPQPSPPVSVSVSVMDPVMDRVISGATTFQPPTPPPVMIFPVTGNTSKQWPLTAAYFEDLQRDYEHMDVLAECKKASAWLKANPGRVKTVKGMPAFLVNWMSRATNSGRGSQPQQAVVHSSPNADAWDALARKRQNR